MLEDDNEPVASQSVPQLDNDSFTDYGDDVRCIH